MSAEDWELLYQLAAIVGLTVITVITRAFFMIPKNELPLPDWLRAHFRILMNEVS